jgi:hypothetical protein
MKEILLVCLTGFLLLVVFMAQLFVIYILYRSHKVYSYRKKVSKDTRFTVAERKRRLESLPSYDRMVWQLRRFNWDDFLKEKNSQFEEKN